VWTLAPRAAAAQAESCFTSSSDLFGHGEIYAVAAVDLDGDTDLDIVVGENFSFQALVLLNNGSGGFGAATPFATGVSPRGIAIGDVDGGGVPDLVVANNSAGTISVLLGNGDGTFQAQQTFATRPHPMGVVLGDLNGDTRLDVVVANDYENGDPEGISILLGNGDGTFQPHVDMNLGDYVGWWDGLALGDLNGDSRLDLAVATKDAVVVLIGNGLGGFTPLTALSTVGLDASAIAIGDLNGDSHPDLVFTTMQDESTRVLLGNGDGTFVAGAPLAGSWFGTNVALGDFNGDGDLDVAVAQGNAGIKLATGNGDGTLRPFVSVAGSDFAFGLVAAQLTSDSRLDLLGTSVAGSAAIVFSPNGCSTTNGPPSISAPASVTTAEDTPVAFTTPAATRILITDGDASSGQIGVQLSATSGSLTLSGVSGLTFTSGANGTSAMTFLATLANANAALDGMTFTPAANTSGPVTLNVATSDRGFSGYGPTGTASETRTITINAANDPPVLTAPAAQTIPEGAPLIFSAANANRIAVADPDGGSLQVTLTATNGTATLSGTAGLSVSGNGTALVTASGPLASLNAALEGLRFDVPPNVNGAAGLALAVDDLANGGGSPLTASGTVPITIAAVNDPPTLSAIADQSTTSGTATAALPFTVGDVETPPGQLTLSATSSNQSVVANSGISFGGNGSSRSVVVVPLANRSGATTITLTVSDGDQTASRSFAVSVAGTNAPAFVADDAYATAYQTMLTVAAPGVLANDSDVNGATLQAAVVQQPTHGALSLSPNGSFTYTPAAGFSGADSFTYQVSNGVATSQTARVSLTTAPIPCSPRPNPHVQTAARGDRLDVMVEAAPLGQQMNNPLTELRFDPPTNARITMDGRMIDTSQGAAVITAPPSTIRQTFTVERLAANQATIVPFTVVDACGPWKTFVGGGAAAGF
jgi:hypothetical protein